MLIQYNDLPKEIRKTGLTQKEVSDILGITPQALNARIRKGKPDIHLIMYALSHYYNKDDNLGERDL
jgi:predicted transcriptional regulator